MEKMNHKRSTKTRKVKRWFSWKQKRDERFQFNKFSDGSDCEDDSEETNELYIRSLDIDRSFPLNELRIFVGTWNVAGKSPVGNLAVDLEGWLNLKDAADMYVLGFQEVVPLKAANVIGAEDPTEATNWNMLIGKALNEKPGAPWLTPMINPISNDNYRYAEPLEFEKAMHVSSLSSILSREHSTTQYDRPNSSSGYKLLASKKMVGIFLSIWMKKDLLRKHCVSNVKVCSVACGIMGCLGNKGSVSVSMSIDGTSFCFIVAHLASGEKKGDEGRRNHQVSEIFRRTGFPRLHDDYEHPHPITILGHDQIFWFGDLNYRLYLEDNLARELIELQDWRALQEFDQLKREQQDGGVFQGWKEGSIEFAPTYKYSSSNCNIYSGGLPGRSGEKQRTPAWCDRILWYGKGVKQLAYFRSEIKFSDHRPVSALFSADIENVRSTYAKVVPLPPVFSAGTAPVQKEQSMTDEESKSTLLSLIVKDMERETPLDIENVRSNYSKVAPLPSVFSAGTTPVQKGQRMIDEGSKSIVFAVPNCQGYKVGNTTG